MEFPEIFGNASGKDLKEKVGIRQPQRFYVFQVFSPTQSLLLVSNINYFGNKKGFDILLKIISDKERLSFQRLKQILIIFYQVCVLKQLS
jgi:hypothetical protein